MSLRHVRSACALAVAMPLASLILCAAGQAAAIRENTWITNGTVRGIAYANNTIYLGGSFSWVGPATGSAATLGRFSEATLVPYPRVNGTVRAVAVDQFGGCYIGGLFTSVQGKPRTNLAYIKADGTIGDWNPGTDGEVDAIAIGPNQIFVGGEFTNAGGSVRPWIAGIDSGGVATTFAPSPDGTVRYMNVLGSYLYIGGDFTHLGADPYAHFAQLQFTGAPTGWGLGTTTTVLTAMLVSPSGLLCMAFSYPGTGVYNFGVWDATTAALLTQSPIGADGAIRAFAVDVGTNNIYVAGDFQTMKSSPRMGLAAFDGSTFQMLAWNPIQTFGHDGIFYSLSCDRDRVYVGGSFSVVENQPRSNFVAISETTGAIDVWSPNPTADVYGGAVYAFGHTLGGLFVAGDFATINAVPRSNAAAIDASSGMPTSWNPNVNGRVNTVYISGSSVYLGGAFSSVGGASRNRAAAVDATDASVLPFDPNVDVSFPTEVYAFALSRGFLYMGGAFSSVGGQTRGGIAAVDPASGSLFPFDAHVNGAVYTVSAIPPPNPLLPPTVFIGGQFTSAGGATRFNIAELDGGTGGAFPWAPTTDGSVSTMTVSVDSRSGNVTRAYVGGAFANAGGQPRSCIAELDANGLAMGWNPGASSVVENLFILGSNVYICGGFTTAGGQPRNHIAAIDVNTGNASPWDPDAENGIPPGWVYSMLQVGPTLYAAGSFRSMSGGPQSYLAGIINEAVTGVEGEPMVAAPKAMGVSPNPFASDTRLRFSLARSEPTTIDVYDPAGRLVRRLYRGVLGAGYHQIDWHGTDEADRPVGSGVYFASVRTANQTLSSKIFKLR